VLGCLITAAGLGFIAATTMVPLAPGNQGPPSWFGNPSIPDILRNVLLYVPFGFGLRQGGLRSRSAILIAVALSAIVEIAQLGLITGRNASMMDVTSNTLGAAAGVSLATHWHTLLHPGARLRSHLFASATSALLAILVASAFGLRVSLPPGQYRVQWAPQGVGHDWFHGELLAAFVSGTSLRGGMSNPIEGRGAMWLSRDIALLARFVPGKALSEESTIVGIGDSTDEIEIVELDQERSDLRFRVRTLTGRVGLEVPTVVLEDVLASGNRPQPTDTMVVTAALTAAQLSLSVRGKTIAEAADIALSPSVAWLALSPWSRWKAGTIRLISAVWIMVLVFPLGFWSAGEPPSAYRDLAVVAFALVIGLVASPSLAGTHLGTWMDWIACVIGCALGMGAQRLLAVHDESERAAPTAVLGARV